MTARGLRNNNPGNIVQSGIEWRGKVVPSTDPRFETFDTPHNGIRAAAKLLLSYQDKHGLRTVRGIINRWAPPAENDTGAYVNIVAGELGVHADDQIDLHRFTTLVPLVSAIIRHENGEQPYAAELIAAAVSDALEVEAPVPDTPAPVTPEIPANTSAPEPVNPIARIPIVGPLLIPLLTALTAVPDILKIFAGKQPSEVAQRNTALATKVAEVAVDALKATGPGDAIDKLATDPAAVQTVAAAVKADPALQLMLVEAGGGGIAGARAFVAQVAATPQGAAMTSILRIVTFWVLGFLTFANVAGFGLAGVMVWLKLGEWQQITSTLIQADINAAFAAIGFWLGSSIAKGGTPAVNVRSDP